MSGDRYEIRLTYYDSNWKEKTRTLPYGGALLGQMKDLLHGLKDKQGDRAIRLFIYDKEKGKELDEYTY